MARAINSEVKAGRGSPHGGVFLDIASRRTAEYIRRRLPSMYHQFMELAGVDITATPMEVGPTCHYMMGGVRVDADTEAATVPGLFAAGEVAGGMHGANRLGGNSLSDLLVFGRRAGIGAADFAEGRSGDPAVDEGEVEAAIAEALAPLERDDGENPYDIHHDLQETMQSLVGIIRTGPELEEALEKLAVLEERAEQVSVGGGRAYNPGWNLATDLPVHADRLGRRGPGGAGPQGEPGRAHPGGLPGRRPRTRQGQLRPAPGRPAGPRRTDRRQPRATAGDAGRTARAPRGGTLMPDVPEPDENEEQAGGSGPVDAADEAADETADETADEAADETADEAADEADGGAGHGGRGG